MKFGVILPAYGPHAGRLAMVDTAFAAEQLRAYQQAGLNYAVLEFPAPNQAARERAMQTFARQVMPEFAKA